MRSIDITNEITHAGIDVMNFLFQGTKEISVLRFNEQTWTSFGEQMAQVITHWSRHNVKYAGSTMFNIFGRLNFMLKY